jgi:hypothetical protein
VFDAVDSMIAARSALRAVTRAVGVAVPRVFGREAALGVVGDQLHMASELLATSAAGLRGDAAEAAALLDTASTGVREAAGTAQSRAGAQQLGRALEGPRASIEDALAKLRAQGIDTLDEDVVDTHLALRRTRDQMDAMQWDRLAGALERSETARAAAPGFDAALAREAAELHVANGSIPADWHGWPAFDEARAGVRFRTPETTRARLLEVADLPEGSVGATELADVAAIARRGDELRPAGLSADDAADFAEAARRAGLGEQRPLDWDGWTTLRRVAADAAFPTREDATARANALLRTGYDKLGDNALRDLQRLRVLPADRTPAPFTADAPLAELDEFVSSARRGGAPSPTWNGWNELDSWRASLQLDSREAATARHEELVRPGRAQLTRDELHEFNGIVRLPEATRPAVLEGLDPDSIITAFDVRNGLPASWSGLDVLDRATAIRTWPTRDAATEHLRTILGHGGDELTPDAWRDVVRLAQLPDELRPAGLPTASTFEQLRATATSIAGGGKVASSWNGFKHLDAARVDATYATREAAEQRLAEIALRPREELTARDLHDLSGLLQLDEARRPSALAGVQIADASQAARLRATGEAINTRWGGWALLDTAEAATRWPTAEAAAADLRSLLGTSYDEMTPESWDRLARMSKLPDATRPAALPSTTDLETVATNTRTGREINAKWAGWRTLNLERAEATIATREQAEARLAQLVETPEAELSRQDLHDLDGLAQLPEDRRPADLAGTTLTSIAEAAELRGRGKPISVDWQGWDLLGGIRIAKRYPTAEAAQQAAVTALGGGYDDMDPARWRTLADLSMLPAEQRPGLLANGDGTAMTKDLRTVATYLESGKATNQKWQGWRRLNQLRADATFTSREQAQARLTELVQKTEGDLTRQDLHDLDGLLQLDEARRPEALAGATLASAAEAAELRGMGKPISTTWDGWNLLTGIRISTRWPDAAAARTAATEALGAAYDEMDPARWRTLADLSMLPAEKRPALLVNADGSAMTNDLRTVATNLEAGTAVNQKWQGWRRLNALRADATISSREQADARLAELLERDQSELTRQDLHDLDGLLQLDDTRRPALLNGATLTSVAEAAELRGMAKPINDTWDGWNLLSGIRAAAHWPTRESAQEAAVSLLGHSYEDMTPAAWRQLADMSTLPADLRPELLVKRNGSSLTADLRTVATNLESGTAINAKWDGWRQLNKLRAEATWNTPELASLRLRELAARGRDQLTRQDLHDLDGLVQLADGVRPPALSGATTLTSAAEAAELRGAGRPINAGWDGWKIWDAMELELKLPSDPAAREAWVRSELTRRLSGTEFDPALGTVLRLRPDLIPDDLRAIGQLAIANEMLRDIATVGVTSSAAPRPALEQAQRALEAWRGGASAAGIDGIAEQTRTLVKRNLDRVNGVSKGPIAGYSNYADLAEVGRIRSNIELLERVSPRPVLPEAPAPAGDAAAAAGQAADAAAPGETLTW